jgi:hypothetical protein
MFIEIEKICKTFLQKNQEKLQEINVDYIVQYDIDKIKNMKETTDIDLLITYAQSMCNLQGKLHRSKTYNHELYLTGYNIARNKFKNIIDDQSYFWKN